jgi:hypothetical protein
MSATDLPDVSNLDAGMAHAGIGQATLHGVVFDIFGGERDPA